MTGSSLASEERKNDKQRGFVIDFLQLYWKLFVDYLYANTAWLEEWGCIINGIMSDPGIFNVGSVWSCEQCEMYLVTDKCM